MFIVAMESLLVEQAILFGKVCQSDWSSITARLAVLLFGQFFAQDGEGRVGVDIRLTRTVIGFRFTIPVAS
jgi:hypothetical protein